MVDSADYNLGEVPLAKPNQDTEVVNVVALVADYARRRRLAPAQTVEMLEMLHLDNTCRFVGPALVRHSLRPSA